MLNSHRFLSDHEGNWIERGKPGEGRNWNRSRELDLQEMVVPLVMGGWRLGCDPGECGVEMFQGCQCQHDSSTYLELCAANVQNFVEVATAPPNEDAIGLG